MAVHIINLRSPADGNGITGNPQASPPLSAQSIILIHGYNDSLVQAREAYASFLNPNYDPQRVRSLPSGAWTAYIDLLKGDTLDSISRWGEVCLVFWPANVWGGLSALAYVQELKLAAASAPALATALLGLKRSPQPQAALVCHSMGNRLALQMLEVPNPSIQCRSMCLMAAAVAVQMVTGSAQPYFWPPIAAIEKKRVLYSGSDVVLSTGFPIGEAAAGEGIGLKAIGHAGKPSYAFPDRIDMKPYGHGDYWAAIGDANGTTSRDLLLDFLSTTMLPYPSTAQLGANPGPTAGAIGSNSIASSKIRSHRLGS
jgi:pimeloyl-ACP methyl ester carboxylesterase